MKILNITKYFTLVILASTAISCSQDFFRRKDAKIEFVDLQGNQRKLKLNTPTENIVALTKQGKISEEKIIEEENYTDATKPEMVVERSYNKYGNKGQDNVGGINGTKESKELLYTLDLPTENSDKSMNEKNFDQEVATPTQIVESKQSQNEPVSRSSKRYNLISTYKESNPNAKIISETIIPAKNSRNESGELKSGIYVQAGSFSSKDHAIQHIDKIRSLTNNARNINIQPAKVSNKNYYRVVVGPLSKKDTANLMVKDLKKKGQNSIIIQIK